MKITHRLLSNRFSKDHPVNLTKMRDLPLEIVNTQIASHDMCPACGSTTALLVAEIDRVGFPCSTLICTDCELVFNNSFLLNPVEYYEHTFANEKWKEPEENFLKRTAPEAYTWKRLAYIVSKLGSDFQKIRSVMEIGCADGANLYPYHAFGLAISGFDYDEDFLNAGRRRGLNLIQGDFSSSDEQYDLILLVHVFEHMLALDDVANQVARLLKPGGWVYVEVPGIRNWNRLRKDLKQEDGYVSSNDFLGYLQYQHNYHFDLAHLFRFWQRNGFELVQGDEWCRMILKRGKKSQETSPKTKILTHLQLVEQDFLTANTLPRKIARKFLSKIEFLEN